MIPTGPQGTRQTLNIMARVARNGKKTPVVRHVANILTRELQQKDWKGEIEALHSFVRDRIRYVKDINGVETIHTPDNILKYKQGDCDDKSVLLASLLESIGHKTRFVAVGFAPNRYSHVYPEVLYKGEWIPLETTEPVNIGWKPKGIKAQLIVNVDGSNNNNSSGLAGKRVDAIMRTRAKEISDLLAKANSPEATEEEIAYAQEQAELFDKKYKVYLASERKKKKTFIGKAVSAWESKIKAMRKISPSMKAHAKHIERRDEARNIQLKMVGKIAEPPSAERDAELEHMNSRLKMIASKEKQYMKEGKIAAVIASIVVGIFTFGAGTGLINSAVEAIKQGAMQLAKGMLLSAAAKALTKGAKPEEVKASREAVAVMEQYPPNPNLNTLDEMIKDSYMQKQMHEDKKKTLTAVAIPAGIFALFAFLT